MKRRLLFTFLSRVAIALSAFVVLLLTARMFGPAARGTISLLVVAQTITLLINDIAAGPALVYLVPRFNLRSLILPALFWALASALLIPLALNKLNLIPESYLVLMMIISFCQNFSNMFLMILTGQERMGQYNIITIAQAALIPVIIFITGNHEENGVEVWAHAVIAAQLVSFLSGLIIVATKKVHADLPQASFKDIFGNGLLVQLSTIAYIISIRVAYYFLDVHHGREAVGIFSSGVSVMEAALLLSSSVALIVYGRIANSADEDYNIRITGVLSKYCLLFTFPLLLIAAFLPESVYIFLFGPGFSGITKGMMFLIPGLAVLSFTTVMTHYFSGKGLYRVNLIGSSIGLIVAMISGWLLIPSLGIKGAAITCSLGHLASALYALALFRQRTPFKLLPGKKEISDLYVTLKNGIN